MPSPDAPPGGLAHFPAIPYGRAYFKGIRMERCLYVDKTRFLHALEQERFVFFIRPRRFGKTCWLSMLESYYDRNQADDFERVFAGLDICRLPTPNRGRYVVVRFNFSTFGSDPANLEREFDEYCRRHVRDAVEDNPDLFPDAAFGRIQAPPTINGQLDELFLHARREGIPLYILIDEYDNFANTILAGVGAEAYHAFTHGGGFYRSFFATLKAGTENGSVERLFVTGVSPVTMDDVTSGFNIGANLSLRPEFNEMLGFTEDEVRRMLGTYRDLGVFDQDVETALGTMREWYNGYRFSEEAEGIVYNTDMVLHYVKHCRRAASGHPQPDRAAADVRLPARSLRGGGGVRAEPRGARPAHATDGAGGRLAAGRREAVQGGDRAHRHSPTSFRERRSCRDSSRPTWARRSTSSSTRSRSWRRATRTSCWSRSSRAIRACGTAS